MPRMPVIPVAQYLRMSTERQQYSIANQMIAILQYAATHNMEIVRSYADHGKSGLGLAKRAGLKQLLREAVDPKVDFNAVLVYDVSRWGRFQNPDEAAAYEYMLGQANILIHYCAEPFANDGSLASSILKTLKRGMAGEYSRELSAKVWAGNCHIAELGFHIGGYAGYGLRRQLMGTDHTFKQVLKQGERKSLQSEHVILIPGPPHELEVIHQIYTMYIDDSLSEAEIAKTLNARKIAWSNSRPWARMAVRHILTNPKYIGVSVYNRTSSKLQRKLVRNARSEWIWCAGAFEPIVSEERFKQAHNVSVARARVRSSQELLDGLKALIKREGRISERLIDKDAGIPGSGAYVTRFGSLRDAYRLVGWKADRQERLIANRSVLKENQTKLVAMAFEALSAFDPKMSMNRNTHICTTLSGVAVSLVVTRCSRDRFKLPYWHVYSRAELPVHIRVIGRLTLENDGLLDFFILPNGIVKNSRLSLGTVNVLDLDAYRFENLGVLGDLLSASDAECVIKEDGESATGAKPVARQGPNLARLVNIRIAMGLLVADEDFRNLLRAENSSRVPDVFRRRSLECPDRLALVVCEEYVARLLKCECVRRFIERRHKELFEYLSPGMKQ
jgi:hypothetical protein